MFGTAMALYRHVTQRRGGPGSDGRSWVCIDLPSPDTPRSHVSGRLPHASLAVVSLLLALVAGVTALVFPDC